MESDLILINIAILILAIMGSPSKNRKPKPKTSNEKPKSMNYQEEKASVTAVKGTHENIDKHESEVNIKGSNI